MIALLRSLYMLYQRMTLIRPFLQATHHPAAAQKQVLRRILNENRNTAFGRDSHFAAIEDAEQFRASVAVHDYDALQALIQKQESEGNTLTAKPAVMFTQTSGTTGRAKLLPMTSASMKRMKREQQMLAAWQYKLCPQAFRGKALGIVSPAIEGKTDLGHAFGSASGVMYQSMPKLFQKRYVLPYEVFEIEDYDLKYLLIARLAMQEKHITYLGSANPSTFMRLLDVIRDNTGLLLSSLETGRISGMQSLPTSIRQAVESRLKACPQRAAELREICAHSTLSYENLWPDIALLMSWTGGSCGIALNALKKTLPEKTLVMDPGYLASECRGSFTCDLQQGGVPMLTSNYYEFVERGAWESGERTFLGIDELQQGDEYYLLVTTDSGLYRYFMNDIVTVSGYLNQTPLIRFLRKGSGVVNMTGEKVTESHLLSMMQQIESAFHFDSLYFLCLANEDRSAYQLFIEPGSGGWSSSSELAQVADEAMRASNLEYDQKRASGRLHTMEAFRLAQGTADAIKRFFVASGQRENQFKPPVLMLAGDFLFPVSKAVTC